jgi:N-acetylmuramoyl-L-alanine amidase
MDFAPKPEPLLQNRSKPAPKPVLCVQDIIDRGDCSTAAVRGLSMQIVNGLSDRLHRLDAPNFVIGEACYPYFQPQVWEALLKALKSRPGWTMTCNSAFRSPAQQLILWEHYQRKRCNISLAAKPGGRAPHMDGTAIDINEWKLWMPVLEQYGFEWQGNGDPMHFTGLQAESENIAAAAIASFQKLCNKKTDRGLAIDGDCGELTLKALRMAPVNGW